MTNDAPLAAAAAGGSRVQRWFTVGLSIALLVCLALVTNACSGPLVNRPSSASPASVRAPEAPLPPIATSITHDPLDPSTLKPSTGMKMRGGRMHHGSTPPPADPGSNEPAAQPPASAPMTMPMTMPMNTDKHGADHAP